MIVNFKNRVLSFGGAIFWKLAQKIVSIEVVTLDAEIVTEIVLDTKITTEVVLDCDIQQEIILNTPIQD